jgi:hypothetical protein
MSQLIFVAPDVFAQNRAPSPLEAPQTLHFSPPGGESDDEDDPSPRSAEPRQVTEEALEKPRTSDRTAFEAPSNAETAPQIRRCMFALENCVVLLIAVEME